MSDYKLPELPSDDELGITDEDREQFEKDFPDDGPEMSADELAALLGEAPPPKGKASKAPKAGGRKKAKPTPTAGASKPAAGEPSSPKEPAARAAAEAEKKPKPTRAERKEAKAEARERARRGKETRKQEKEELKQQKAARKREQAEARAAELPVPGWRGPVTLAFLILTAVFASSRTGLPDPVPANAPDTAFSSARAMSTLIEIARMAHPPGSPEHARVRDLIVGRLRELGLDPQIQTTTSVISRGEQARAATVRNIVARIPGTSPTGAVLITAHYDSREIAVGAGDDGVGVVSVLEAVRALRAGPPVANDVIVLITDGEELGLLGARAFVDRHPWMADVDIALSFEMRGAGGPSIMFETNEENGWIVNALGDFDPAPYANSFVYEVYKHMPNDTDFSPIKEAGVQGLNFAAIDNAHVYHQTYDRPENVSEATIQHHGLRALAGLRYLGAVDLSDVKAPNQVFFSVPGIGLVHYAGAWVLPISVGLLLLFGLLTYLAWRRGARPGAMLASVGLGLLLAGLGFGAGWGLLQRVSGAHPEMGGLQGSAFHSEGWYLLALAFTALALVAGAASVSRRWLSRDELAVGALLPAVLAAIALGFAAPLGAMNLQWPALAAVAAAIALTLLGQRATGTVGWVATLVLALPVILLVEPLTELLWLALSIRLAGALVVLATLGLLLCLPLLGSLAYPNRWWAPLTAAVVAVAALGMGTLAAKPDSDRPLPTTLAYAYEHGSGQAMWVTAPHTDSSAYGARVAGWAEERSGGAFQESRDLAGFGYPLGVVPVHSAPMVDAPPPVVEVIRDSVSVGERDVTLAVHSQIGAEMLGFLLDGGTRVRSINGMPLSDEVRMLDHWGTPDDSVVLELTMPPTEAIGVNVLEHLLRPQELLGPEPFMRPDDMAPNVNRLSDRAMFRYSVAAFVDPRHAFMRPPTTSGADSTSTTGPSPAGPVSTETSRVMQTDTSGAKPTDDTSGATPDSMPVDTMVVDTTTTDASTTVGTPTADTARIDATAIDTAAVDTTTDGTHPSG